MGVAVGSTPLAWTTILRVIASKMLPHTLTSSLHMSPADEVIVWLIRVPRVIVAGVVGAGLSVAGVIMQALFRNPLAELGLVGPGAGAVLGGVISFVAGWSASSVISLPLAAMAGSLVALGLVYAMATRGGVTPINSLLLADVAVGALLGAIWSLLLSINIVNWQIAQDIVFWTMGGLDARTWTHVWLCASFLALGLTAALIQGRDLDLIQQGEETAASFRCRCRIGEAIAHADSCGTHRSVDCSRGHDRFSRLGSSSYSSADSRTVQQNAASCQRFPGCELPHTLQSCGAHAMTAD